MLNEYLHHRWLCCPSSLNRNVTHQYCKVCTLVQSEHHYEPALFGCINDPLMDGD